VKNLIKAAENLQTLGFQMRFESDGGFGNRTFAGQINDTGPVHGNGGLARWVH
jgi:hypothetical protein